MADEESTAPILPAAAASGRDGTVAPARSEGLSPTALHLHARVVDALRHRRIDQAEVPLAALRAMAADHPEVLRLDALLLFQQNRYEDGADLLKRAIDLRPRDALLWKMLGSALDESGATAASLAALRTCTVLEPQDAAHWFTLGRALDRHGDPAAAHEALKQALACDEHHVDARIALARVLQFLGRADAALVEYRRVLAASPRTPRAWFGLSTLRTVAFSADDAVLMQALHDDPDVAGQDRVLVGFALAKALEDCARPAQAFAVLSEANAARRRRAHWNADTFTRYVDAIASAFDAVPSSAPVGTTGNDLVFIVGLPRSGSTLVEQILAAHPRVVAGGELQELPGVIEEESRRRRSVFPHWTAIADASDWQRLGRDYLERTAHLRTGGRVLTDKGLANWRYVGAVARMLPGARFIDCRRDPLENCLACFRQLFASEQAYSYDLDELVRYLDDYERLMRHWRDRHPQMVHRLDHEALLADPATQIRRLLDVCGLSFDAACLRPHEVARDVRTASAAQVREPLRRATARADRYGSLLDPLRVALARRLSTHTEGPAG